MSASASPQTAVVPNVATLRGRIVAKARQFSTRDGVRQYATLLRLPALDEFSSAATVEVRSSERLGEPGDTWTGRVTIGGSARSFSYKDKSSGEPRNGVEVTHWLTVA